MNGEQVNLVVAHYGATKTAPAAAKPAPAKVPTSKTVAEPKPAIATTQQAVSITPTAPRPIIKSSLQLLLEALVNITKPHAIEILKA
jgi:hypothetical protein